MIPILYSSSSVTEGTVPQSFGIGPLSDVISCECPEERNSIYELNLVYPANGIHADQIQYGSFIKAKPNFTDSPQLFQVIKIGKTMGGQFTVYCQHVSYLLSGKVITGGTAGSCTAACLLLTASAGGFTITTDKNVSAGFEITEPSSVRSWFGGKRGSLLDVYGTAEWHYDNFTATLKAHRGSDRGVQIRYGKNLTELSQEISMENLCTGIIPFCIDDDGNKTVGTRVATGLTLDFDRDRAVDFSDDIDFESSTPVATQLSTLVTNYIANNDFIHAFNSITLDFVQLSSLQERVDLCDTVHIYFDALGITASLKCVACTWDVLNERYTSCTFGDLKSSIADTITTQEKKIDEKPSKSFMDNAINHATDLISGNLGGYVLLHDADGDGYPDEILILDNASNGDIDDAVDVWRWNKNGLGHSGNGYAGPYDNVAITYDGQIVADAITTGVLNASLIKAGVISDVQGNSQIDMTNGSAKLYELIAKRDFTVIDDSNNVVGYLTDATYGGLFALNNHSEAARVRAFVGQYDDGVLDIFDGNGNVTVSLSGNEGRIRATNSFEEVYSGTLSTIGAWWTFLTDFAGLLIVGKVRASGSRSTTIIPVKMLDATPVRYYLSDETNYISFNTSIVDGLVKVEIAAKSADGFIEKVYGMF